MRKYRIGYVDLGKCFAIWLVLWGHAMTQLMPSHDLDNNPAFVWLYSFHMPMFMMMSGLFARKALRQTFLQLVWSKFKQLIVPSLIFGAIWLAVDKPQELMHGDALGIGLRVAKHFATCYWFLKSLFLCFVIGWIISRCRMRYIVVIAIIGILLYLQRWNITCFKLGSMLPFFLFGVWLKPNLEWVKNRAPELFIAFAMLHSILILSDTYTSQQSFPTYFFANESINLAVHNYGVYLATAFCGCILTLCSCVLLERLLCVHPIEGVHSYFDDFKCWLLKWMREIGSITLWIYLCQKILLEILLPKVLLVDMPLWCYDLLFTPVIATITLLASVVITKKIILHQ